MPSFNRVILIGNLTRDPELRYIPSGTAVAEIGLAVNERRKGPNGERIEEVNFIDITCWGRTAEIVCEYFTKGSPILIEGRLKQDRWEKDGQKHSKLKVTADKIEFISSRESGGGGGSGPHASGADEHQYSSSAAAPSPSRQSPPPPPDGDLPF